jgi:uncharacterized small protein (DUF1192 family)
MNEPVMFITVLHGVITSVQHGDINADFFGTPYYGHERREVPYGARVAPLEPLAFYDEGFIRKPDGRLIDEGLMETPEGYVGEGDEIRNMAEDEKIIAGPLSPKPGFKVEHGAVVPMSLSERAEAGLVRAPSGCKLREDSFIEMAPAEKPEAGLITGAQYQEAVTARSVDELNRRLAGLSAEEAKAMAELDGGYAARRKAKIAALLAVKQQDGWPVSVIRPA